jgi:hypothetical protein
MAALSGCDGFLTDTPLGFTTTARVSPLGNL